MAQIIRENKRYLTWAFYIVVAVVIAAWLQPLAAEKPGNQIVQRTILGVLLGGVYAIIALGIIVINKASGVFNFGHGGMMMISGFLFFTFFTSSEISALVAAILATATVVMFLTMGGWRELLQRRNLAIGAAAIVVLTVLMTIGGLENRWLHALGGATCGAVLMGLTIERFAIRPLIGQPIFTAVMVTLALGEVLSGLTQLLWGAQPKSLLVFSEPHPFIPGQLVRIQQPITIDTTDLLGGNVIIDQPRLFAFLLALAAFGIFWLFFRFTNIGLSMRATSEDQQLAQSVGLRVRTILAITWGVAAVLAGVAGILSSSSSNSSAIDTNLQYIVLRAFPAVLLGGLESINGALVGGLVIGLTEEWAKMLFSGDVAEQLAPYIVLMVGLIIRPEGLFGEERIERV